ncbi:MAG: HD domain-containing protein [Chloroflexi bacterium]|nr:HD domain-containing protein [Chloroflexota bacterium]
MPTLDDALAIALAAHRGQVDKAGEPYILHPLRVMLRMRSETERIVALLHDVVEDSDRTLDDLRRDGFADEVVASVGHLTRHEGELYEHFIERVRPHPLARRVKLADLEDNLALTRLAVLDVGSFERVQRYLRAWHELRRAESEQAPTA